MSLIMDSGAFSAWSKGVEIDIDAYIEYLLEYEQGIDIIVNLDVIPATPGQKKISKKEIERSASSGYANYNKMIDAGLPKNKIVHVFHQNEGWEWLIKMTDEMEYIGLSPANDRTTEEKIIWLDQCMKYVCDENGIPKVKFHGFAVTSHRIMERYPWWSVDSSSWAIQAGLGSVYIPSWDKKKKEWNYSVCNQILMTLISKDRDNYTNLSKERQEVIRRYIEDIDLVLGESEYSIVKKDYELKNKERWVVASKAKNMKILYDVESEKVMEKVIAEGVRNTYRVRAFANAYFINQFQKIQPEWPWAFKQKKIKRLF